MRPRKVVAVETGCESTLHRRTLQLEVWGYRALDARSQLNTSPHCLLLDGLLDPARIAAARERWPGIPVLVLLTLSEPCVVQQMEQAGADIVLNTAVYGNAEVRECLRVLCSRKRGPKTAPHGGRVGASLYRMPLTVERAA